MEYIDVLAKLGVGNAHPGGFSATIKQLEQYPLPAHSHVLEVGCGTGRTACYLAKLGYNVTAVDIRSDMVLKAEHRAMKENVNIHFLIGDACGLPFPEQSFDVVFAESVSVFADTPRAIAEYRRVLKTGGTVYDREVTRIKDMPEDISAAVNEFYGIQQLWSMEQWTDFFNAAGFKSALADGTHEFPKNMSEDLLQYPDHFQQADADYLYNADMWQLSAKYDEIMARYYEYLGYTLVIGRK